MQPFKQCSVQGASLYAGAASHRTVRHGIPWALCLVQLLQTSAWSETTQSYDWEAATQFWSVQPMQSVTAPDVHLAGWSRQRLDFFVLSTLEEKGLQPSEAASSSALLRRLHYDLTGLPVSFGDVQSFLRDDAPDAYERRVEQLLESPQFGERMASMWLPLARYAEDQAHQVGADASHAYPNAYHYRRWVVDAFNRDLAYDDFIRLQLAGDLYPHTEHEDLVATGFIGLGPKYYNRGRLDVKAEEWADQVDTVMRTFQGLTVACARCHDHKSDPITMEDYYGIAGIFASTELVNRAYDKPADKVTKEDLKSHRFTAHVVKEGTAKNLPIFIRGNVDQKGRIVDRRFLSWLSGGHPKAFNSRGSGRRELAESIATPQNPLTSRVYVNRLWSLFFGQGLVRTPSNFGLLGAFPTHPELLEDLAFRFIQGGSSTKRLVREMVLSSTYRQSSRNASAGMGQETDTRWLAGMPRRRLSVEMWRDTLLMLSGNLQFEGGPSIELDDPQNMRRTLYGRVSRLKLNDLLMQMDYPDANVHAAHRNQTTTPLQKLYAMNSSFVLHQSDSIVADLALERGVQEGIHTLYRRCLGRGPNTSERTAAAAFLKTDAKPYPDIRRWASLAQVLFMSNEMLYLD